MGARYYDPRIGRFLQPDPLGINPYSPQTWDLYAYAGNNPVNWTDPTGMCSWNPFRWSDCLREKGIKYVDVNVSLPLLGPITITGGVMSNFEHYWGYAGGGVGTPGGSVTVGFMDVATGWNYACNAGYGFGGQLGTTDLNGGWSPAWWEMGGMTGGGCNAFYVFTPIGP